MVVNATVTSRLLYCNSLRGVPMYDSITPVLRGVHWLPVQAQARSGYVGASSLGVYGVYRAALQIVITRNNILYSPDSKQARFKVLVLVHRYVFL